MLGSPILYLKGHEDIDVPTFWHLLYGWLSILGSFLGPYYNTAPNI